MVPSSEPFIRVGSARFSLTKQTKFLSTSLAAFSAHVAASPTPSATALLERERERESLLGTIHNGGSRTAPAHGLRITTWCRAAAHAARSVAACNRGPPSSTSASTSGLSRPVLPRRLWRVVGWVGFLLGRDRWGGERVVGGALPPH
jgi:hypothetical protein